MSDPSRGSASTESQIVAEWTAPSTDAETGGSAITGYEIIWDVGDGLSPDTSLAGLMSSYTATTYTQASGLTAGNDYIFQVRAKNIYGWGDYSNEITMTAASVPDAMSTVTTSVVSGEVKIVFVAPDDNGEGITGYDIEVRYSDEATYAEDLTDCDGSDGTIMSNMFCTIPMATLVNAGTYNLAYADLVVVRARAYNSLGAGDYSQINTDGATIETEPIQITSLAFDSDMSTTSQIVLNWDLLATDAEIGGSAITSYTIEWDQGTSTWADIGAVLSDTDDTYTKTGLTTNTDYVFRIFATNIYGDSTTSSELTVLTAD
jgi:hypothetical protein